MLTTLVATLVVALPLATLFWMSDAVSFGAALATLTLLASVLIAAGSLTLRALRAADMPLAAAWVLGVCTTALAVYALVGAFHLRATTAFVAWTLIVLALGAAFGGRARVATQPRAGELLGLLLCAAATLAWCRELAEVPHLLARDGVLTTWTDQFIHGSAISQFGDPRAAGRQSIELADFQIPFYHYASYMLPAALAWPLDVPGLPLATSVWVPLGFFTLCAAIYALGASLGGPVAGVAALGALTLMPDAASYGLHNRLFGYYWYVLAVPGASYGVANILLAIAFLQRWTKSRDVRCLLASVGLVAGSLLIRMHIFLLALPAWLAFVATRTQFVRRRTLLSSGVALAGFGLFVWAFYALSPDSVPALERFLDVTHTQQQPVAYRGLYQGLMSIYGPAVAVPVGVLLVFPAFLGVFAFLYPLSVLLVHRSRGLQAIDLVPPALLACYLALMVSAPVPPHGDSTELTQRPFVLVYAVIAIWTAAGFASWLEVQGGLRTRRVWLPLLVAGALAVVWVLRSTVKDWRWAYSYQVAEGLPQAASFMRSHARPGDILAAQGLKPGLVTTDLAIQLVSLTGMPAYVTRPFIHISAGGPRAQVAVQRYAALGAVAREESPTQALARLRSLGIQWYVVAEKRGPRWDPERRRAAFAQGMVAVYAVGP